MEDFPVLVLLPESSDQSDQSDQSAMLSGLPLRARLLPEGREAVASACATAIASRWRLSPKREQIVVGILLGESTTEIAERAAIAPSTVKTHIRAILQRTGRQNKLGILALLFDILRAAIELPIDED